MKVKETPRWVFSALAQRALRPCSEGAFSPVFSGLNDYMFSLISSRFIERVFIFSYTYSVMRGEKIPTT